MRAVKQRLLISAILPVALAALAGCSSVGDRAAAAGAVAVRLLQAVDERNGTAACAVLAPQTAAEVAQSEQKPCSEAILDQDLPKPAAVGETSVYGQWAQVHLAGDTQFLAVFPGGWRVVAAGCTPRGDRPYRCLVQGS